MDGFQARPGEVLGGRYRLLRQLGEGGMGEVWEAVHVVLNRQVAVKVLKPRFAQQGEVLLRFRREAQVMAGLGHPKIVEVIDFAWEPGQPAYLVMELLKGRSLAAALGERGCLAWPLALGVALDVLDALGAAHAAGIVHRDMKPANVWLEGDLNEPRVKVLDFGVAQIADDGGPKLTKTNTTIGTPQYLPPEQIAGSRVDGRADLWALGVTLYETLAGRPPFVGGDFAALVGAILTQDPPPLQSLVPEVPAELAEGVAAALSKRPDDRPQTAEAMAAPLRELSRRVARKHGKDAFAATMELPAPRVAPVARVLSRSERSAAMGFDATVGVGSSEHIAAPGPALDSSPRLPKTRVHLPSEPANPRLVKKRKLGQSVMLGVVPLAPVGPVPSTSLAAGSRRVSGDAEPVASPTRSRARWLLVAVAVTLLGGSSFAFVTLFAHPRSAPARSAVRSEDTPQGDENVTTPVGIETPAVAVTARHPPRPGMHVGQAGSTRALSPEAPAVAASHPSAPQAASPRRHAPHASPPRAHVPEPVAGADVTAMVQPAGSNSPVPPDNVPSASAVRATHLRRGDIGGSYDHWAAETHLSVAETIANRCVARSHVDVSTGTYRVEVPPDARVERVTGGQPDVRRCLQHACRLVRWSPPVGGASQFLTVIYQAVP